MSINSVQPHYAPDFDPTMPAPLAVHVGDANATGLGARLRRLVRKARTGY